MNLSKPISFHALLTLCGGALMFAQFPQLAEGQPPSVGALTAEVWPYEIARNTPPKIAFEQWRVQQPADAPQILALDGLEIPARESSTMVRISGVVTAPVTGNYAFFVTATGKAPNVRTDPTELWLMDERIGGWRLAQTSGNPNKRSGRTFMEKDVPRRFELWAMGTDAVSIEWEVREWDPVAQGPAIALTRQPVPASALQPRGATPVAPQANGPHDMWKQRHGLTLDQASGPDSPWGDPDGDGLLNWQEMLRDSDPKKADTVGIPGLVRWELWRDIPGRYIFDLRRAPHFPTGPCEIRFLDRLEIPTGNGDHYGSRVRGLLVAPADGEYTFKITADNSAEFWLGENDNWQTKRLIAHTNQRGGSGWARRNEKGETIPLHPEQSATITLKAGQKYYLEILHKQDTSTDHCAVAWVLPGTEHPVLINANNLISWQPCPTDAADDGLPDDWQRGTGLLDAAIAPDMRHAEADADFDGATNYEEWLAGTNPLDATDFPATSGMLTSQSWTNIPGHHISSLVEHPNFPANPDFTTRIDNLDFGHEGENYGVRLRGYLAAPEDGDYQFSIAGNNAALLYLAESEDKFTKRLVSSVEIGTRWRSFATGGHLRSGPIRLERGKKYYIEVLYKRGVNARGQDGQQDHSSVAWIRPGRLETVIAPQFFSPYVLDPRDLDDDDLPDDFEKLHGLDPTDPSGVNGAWGDSDGDGLENFREFQLGLDPNTPDVHGTRGLALWEVWGNLDGLLAAHRDEGGIDVGLWREQTFPLMPQRREWREALDAPRRQGTNFGARLRARIIAPTTGEYVFSIAGRDVGELYLSPDDSKFKRQRIATFSHGTAFRSWDRRPGQMSEPIRLEAGETYYIEALSARGGFHHTDDFFSIGWKQPGEDSFSLIDSKHLIAFFRDPNDQDDDDLPDDWEIRYGLDPTNPRRDHGPHGDPDRDGLTNMEEYLLGTNPNNRDTDGDGISDYDEIHTYHTNPLVPDVVPPVKVADIDLTTYSFASGTWHGSHEDTLISAQRRGAVEFEIHLERAGLYVVSVDAVSHYAGGNIPPVPLAVEINGRLIGVMDVTQSGTSRNWLTPMLDAGVHVVRLENRNFIHGVTVEILGVSILFHDTSGTGDGKVSGWLPTFYAAQNGVENAPMVSHVSPVCLEGISRHPFQVSVETANGTMIDANEGLTGRWFANVPLDADGTDKLKILYEDGAFSEMHEVVWTPANIFEIDHPVMLREGDSLKVFAIPPGGSDGEPGELRMDGESISDNAAVIPSIIAFDQPGSHLLSARSGSHHHEVRVEVLASGFSSAGGIAAGGSRTWPLPEMDRRVVLQSDPGVELSELAPLGDELRRVRVSLAQQADGAPRVLARLPEGGPVAAVTALETFRVVDSANSLDAHVVNILPDGTRVVEIGILIEGVIPPDFLLAITLIVPDAVFANGDTRFVLRASDFDSDGVARLTIYKAPGQGVAAVCHVMDILEFSEDAVERSED